MPRRWLGQWSNQGLAKCMHVRGSGTGSAVGPVEVIRPGLGAAGKDEQRPVWIRPATAPADHPTKRRGPEVAHLRSRRDDVEARQPARSSRMRHRDVEHSYGAVSQLSDGKATMFGRFSWAFGLAHAATRASNTKRRGASDALNAGGPTPWARDRAASARRESTGATVSR